MPKNKLELQADLEAANKRIAELSQSNQNANSNINNDEPPSWLKTFLEAQSESQRQMQQIIKRSSQQQLPQSANSERSKLRKQTADINGSNNEARQTKADAQKPSTRQVEISLAEFSKWRKSYNNYATVSPATIAAPAGGAGGAIAPPSFEDLGKIKIFRAVRRKYLGKTIVFRAAI